MSFDRETLTIVLVACLVAGVLAVCGAPLASAQSGDETALPASYYGEVSINGEAADEGVTVEAEIDGEVRGSITVDDDGTYGGPGAFDGKLDVSGNSSDEGSEVTFYVDGDDFDRTEASTDPETVTWEPESIEQVNLSADVETSEGGDNETPNNGDDGSGSDDGSGAPGSDDDGSGGGGGGGGGGSVAPAPSPSFEVTGTDVNETVLESGDVVAVNVTVENVGDADGEYDADVTVGGVSIADATVAVDEGATEDVTLTHRFNASGSFDLKINGDVEVATVFVDVESADVTATESADSENQSRDEDGLRVAFDNVSVSSVTYEDSNVTGSVTVEELSRVPLNVTQPEGEQLRTVRILSPDGAEDVEATVEMTADADEVSNADASPEDLVIERYDETADDWASLDTEVIAENGEVVVAAETPRTSLFALTAETPDETPTSTSTPTDASPADDDDDDGESSPDDDEFIPGFTAGIAVLALLLASGLAYRRSADE